MIATIQTSAGWAVPFLCDRHGEPIPAVHETDQRLARIVAGLGGVSGCRLMPADAELARVEQVIRDVHAADYLDFLRESEATASGRPLLDHPFVTPGVVPDTPVVPGMYGAARDAARVVVSAADRLAEERCAYAVCRPPGHHAGAAWLGGYCVLNNAAIAVAALRARGFTRVAVLDVDYHFGNGTAAILEHDEDALYVSLHCSTELSYPYRRVTPANGRQRLFGFDAPPTPADYLSALDTAVAACRAFACEAVVVSVGYDLVAGDPHGGWSFSPDIFHAIGRALARSAPALLLVQEGGYHLDLLAECSRFLALGILESLPLPAGAEPA